MRESQEGSWPATARIEVTEKPRSDRDSGPEPESEAQASQNLAEGEEQEAKLIALESRSLGDTPILKPERKDVIDSNIDLALKVLSMPKSKDSGTSLPQNSPKDAANKSDKEEVKVIRYLKKPGEGKRFRNSYSNERLNTQQDAEANMKNSFEQLGSRTSTAAGRQPASCAVNLFNIKEHMETELDPGDRQLVQRIRPENDEEDSEELKEFLAIEQSLNPFPKGEKPADDSQCRNATRFQEYIIKSPKDAEQKSAEGYNKTVDNGPAGKIDPPTQEKKLSTPRRVANKGKTSSDGSNEKEKEKEPEKERNERRREPVKSTKGREDKKSSKNLPKHVARNAVTTSPKYESKGLKPQPPRVPRYNKVPEPENKRQDGNSLNNGGGNSFVENGKVMVSKISLSSSSFDQNGSANHVGPKTATNAATKGICFAEDKSAQLNSAKEFSQTVPSSARTTLSKKPPTGPIPSVEADLGLATRPSPPHHEPATVGEHRRTGLAGHEKSVSCTRVLAEDGSKCDKKAMERLAIMQSFLDVKEKLLVSVPVLFMTVGT